MPPRRPPSGPNDRHRAAPCLALESRLPALAPSLSAPLRFANQVIWITGASSGRRIPRPRVRARRSHPDPLGTPGRSTYAAAKHALHGYFDSLRAEVWRDNIAVTLACPGYVRTAISVHALGPRGKPHAGTEATPERGIPPERCAAEILRAVARRRREVYIGREVAGIYLQRWLPGLFARLVRRMKFPLDGRSA